MKKVADDKKICGDEHEFNGNPAGLGAKHPLHGKKFNCELDFDHRGNHTAKADDGTPVHWRRIVQVA